MAIVWESHGNDMANAWQMQGNRMATSMTWPPLLEPHGNCMANAWQLHGNRGLGLVESRAGAWCLVAQNEARGRWLPQAAWQGDIHIASPSIICSTNASPIIGFQHQNRPSGGPYLPWPAFDGRHGRGCRSRGPPPPWSRSSRRILRLWATSYSKFRKNTCH